MASHVDHLSQPVTARDHAAGSPDAPVTLVEYGDFECPFCGMAYPEIKDIRQRLGDRLRFVYRHFPRPEHPHARHAAEAAEAAAAQGEQHFWAMQDALFEHQQALEDAQLVRYASDIGLDTGRFSPRSLSTACATRDYRQRQTCTAFCFQSLETSSRTTWTRPHSSHFGPTTHRAGSSKRSYEEFPPPIVPASEDSDAAGVMVGVASAM